ncbi:MAG: hypothetical protein HXS50_03340 [Theionarchaea archaeon]|nr:hypothetical protein [Theionarchaea archaeon]
MRKIFLFAMIEFIEKFGARTTQVEELIAEAEDEKALADRHYMEVDLDNALLSIQSALQTIGDADIKAAELKDSALFQVYLIEWLAVTGVSLLSGSLLYSLMVRRRIYREMGSTRFASDF